MTQSRPEPRLRINLFGGPEVLRNGEAISVSPLQAALLGVVAGHGREGIHRIRLLSFLWSYGSETRLRRRLSQLVYTLKGVTQSEPLICTTGDRYYINPEVTSDLDEFNAKLSAGAVLGAVSILEKGFLSSLTRVPTHDLEKWLSVAEGALHGSLREEAARRWKLADETADWPAAEHAAQAILRLDPQNERALRGLMEARILLGKRHEAHAAFESYRGARLRTMPSWEPQDETTRLVSSVDFVAPPSLPATRNDWTRFPRLVGRGRELGELVTQLKAQPPGFRVIRVLGPEGIGKTALVDAALARAGVHGTLGLRVQCLETGQPQPLALVVEALSALSVRHGFDTRRSKPGAADRREPPSGASTNVAVDVPVRFRREIQRLSVNDPLALFVDGLEWADEQSLLALSRLGRDRQHGSLTLVAAYSPELVPLRSILHEWEESLNTSGTPVLTLRLGPLTNGQIREILDFLSSDVEIEPSNAAEEGLLEEIVALSKGVPGVAVACLRDAAFNRPAKWSEGVRSASLAQHLVDRRIRRLDPVTRRLVTCLSLSGEPLSLSILADACDISVQAVEEAVNEGVHRGILSCGPSGIAITTRFVRDGVATSVPVGERISIHGRLAHALMGLREPNLANRIAYHLLEAGEANEASRFIVRGAKQALDAQQRTEARDLLERAREIDLPLRQSCEVESLLGYVHLQGGEFTAAREAWRRAEQTCRNLRDDDLALAYRLKVLKAGFLAPDRELGTLSKKVKQLRAEAADLGLAKTAAQCMELQVRIADAGNDPVVAKHLIATARGSLGVSDDDAFLELLLVSTIEAIYGSANRAAQIADQAFEVASRMGSADLALRALNWKVIAFYQQAQLNSDEGRALVALAGDVASGARSASRRFALAANLGVWHLDTGDYSSAQRSFDRAAELLRSISAPHLRRNLLLNQGQLALEKGHYSLATDRFLESLEIRGVSRYEPAHWVAVAGIGLAQLLVGKLVDARKCHSQLPRPPRQWTYDPYLWLSLDAHIARQDGRSSLADESLKCHDERLRVGFPTAWMRIRLLRIRLARQEGRSLPAAEVAVLRRLLEERKIPQRLRELRRLQPC